MPDRLDRSALRGDCARCFGLCCVALPFSASADFAVDKAAGEPCRNLLADFGCGIHAHLRERNFAGCVAFDCFGAGQRVSQSTFGGVSWRDDPASAGRMFAVLRVVRQLHELLWYVAAALELAEAEPVHGDLRVAAAELDRLAGGAPDELAETDVAAVRGSVNPLLVRASELARTGVGSRTRDRRGADLVGARLAGADLRGASLRGALLVGADLRRADLYRADLTGADLRGARVSGAALADCLFLTPSQVEAAHGDATTTLPAGYSRPAHW